MLQIAAAIQLRRDIEGEFWLALSGILSIAFVFLLWLFPGAGALGLIWLIGGYAIVLPVGTPEEALDCACGLYLADLSAWQEHQPPASS